MEIRGPSDRDAGVPVIPSGGPFTIVAAAGIGRGIP
ncbi:UNVERIFIED_ORG: hypothetical protein ABIB21_001072 [Arthrobacter sp. UYEF13]